jgi:phosphoribulokinase
VDSLAATEHGLNGLGRTLSSQEQKTAAQIREYLKHAREALNYNDVDGAHTLSEKAKVLLSELSQ